MSNFTTKGKTLILFNEDISSALFLYLLDLTEIIWDSQSPKGRENKSKRDEFFPEAITEKNPKEKNEEMESA